MLRKIYQWRKRGRIPMLFLFAAVFGVCPGATVQAAGTEPLPIYTYEDLLQIAEDPGGSYILMDHIDMEGLAWEPVDFSGSFDGNGFSLLNLAVEEVGAGTAETYDGNYKVYDTSFAGFFGILKGAEVSDLHLVNLKVQVETDQPCFIGGIAGYSQDSTVRGCSIQGRLELSAHDRMFGVGGIVGYGSGLIQQTSAEVTLVCTDTDAASRDEQFMGGAYAAGYMDLDQCDVVVDGYGSDHGYVHDGGLVGMYIFYPRGLDYHGRVTDNRVRGRITFFEDNTDRRAYCSGYMGEIMNWDFTNSGNSADFERNEVFDYSVDLKPDMCADAVHRETVTEPGCDTFGFTTIQCGGCGYTYTDRYTLYRHSVEEWSVSKAPTTKEPGTRTGVCALCGKVLEEVVPKLDLSVVRDSLEESGILDVLGTGIFVGVEGQAAEEDSPSGERDVLEVFRQPAVIAVIIVLVLLLAVGEILIFKDRKGPGGR